MRWTAVWLLSFLFSASTGLRGQDFDYGGYINQQGTAEITAISDGLFGSGTSVVDTMAQAADSNNVAPITGNDYVEGVLGQGIKALGGGVLGELPIADGSAVLGAAAGGDYQTAADTAVAGGMGAVAGWSTAAVVGGLLEGAAVTVGGFTAPAWLPPVVAGATAAYITKNIYNWLLTPPAPAPSGDTAISIDAPFRVAPTPMPHSGAPGSSRTSGRPKPNSADRGNNGDRGGGDKDGGCSGSCN